QVKAPAFAGTPGWLLYGGFWALLLLFCYVVWRVIEKPARAFLVGLWPRPGEQRRTPAAGVVALLGGRGACRARSAPGSAGASPSQQGTASAGAWIRAWWAALNGPGGRLLAGQVVVLALALWGLARWANRVPLHPLSASAAEALARE